MSEYKYLSFDPEDEKTLTNFHRTDEELDQFLMFSIAVAGKQAKSTARAVDRFIEYGIQHYGTSAPFDIVAQEVQLHDDGEDRLAETLKHCGFGCYTQRAKSFIDVVRQGSSASPHSLRSAKPDALERINGIGPKTARFFIMYTRDTSATGENYAAFDTHVWDWLKKQYDDVPSYIPTSAKAYAEWEKKYYAIRDRDYTQMSNSEFDYHIWSTVREAKRASSS